MEKSADRPHVIIYCKKCGKEMQIRKDYLPYHKGLCMSCLKLGNKCARKHGDTNERLYHIYKGLFHRRYKTYSPKVLFKDYADFKNWALSNGYKENLTIDRINNKGDYEPNNCQWITAAENAGKDKRLFENSQKADIYKMRLEAKMTQREMAKALNVSRTTIQRVERYVRGVL